MRNIKNVKIDEMFVHILDNSKPELITSDFPIQLEGNQALMDYFTEHIRGSLSDPLAKAARFRYINPGQASAICKGILSNQTALVDGSKSLAWLLFEIIKKDKRISPADMAVCLFHATENPEEKYLGILKIDPSKNFQHKIIEEDHKVRVTYEINKDALTKERLQKCAFVRPLDPRYPDYDMLMLDRQTGTDREGIIAIFFAERFLDATDTLDATKRTKVFYKTVMDVLNMHRKDLPPPASQDLDQRLTTAIKGESINVNTWLDELPVEEDIRNDFREAIQNKITDIQFTTDRQMGGRLAEKIIYLGDHGLRLSVPVEYYDDLVQSVERIAIPEGDIHEIILRTKTWRRA